MLQHKIPKFEINEDDMIFKKRKIRHCSNNRSKLRK
jgi:hypothetical protein